jgi:hypothetical protein
MVKKRVRDPEDLPDAPAPDAEENDSGSDVSLSSIFPPAISRPPISYRK